MSGSRAYTSWSSGRSRAVVAIAVAVALAATLLVFYARGGGPLPGWLEFLSPEEAGLLDPSTPEEAVLRTLRLAGYDQAAVGQDGGTVIVRLEAPEVRSPADVELSWQTALGSAAPAFPNARRYVAQVFARGSALVEVAVDGNSLRDALDDPSTDLTGEVDIVILSSEGATP